MQKGVMMWCLLAAVLLAVLLPQADAANFRSRQRSNTRSRLAARRGGRGRQVAAVRQLRQGRQDEGGDDGGDDGGEGGDDIPAWCNPEDPMGAWLLFKGVKNWCIDNGFEEFGPYGGIPEEGAGGEEEGDPNAV